jgi:L-ribulose-5-phosphate 4-epimerase
MSDDSLDQLRSVVVWANQELARRDLARFTFGNASAIDRARGLVAIKPSGVPYAELVPASIVVTDLEGRVVAGSLRPSSDLATHLVLFRAFAAIGAVVHTHSHFATAWAQARLDLPCLGTTHADYFHGPVPVTAELTGPEIAREYEANTGHAIVRRLSGHDPMTMPAVLVAGHASFCWGADAGRAVETAAVLEEVAALAYRTRTLAPAGESISSELLSRHFFRKHGPSASYGQDNR